jgi:mRNA interferase HigB
MRLVSDKALIDLAHVHSEAHLSLQIWRRIVEAGNFSSFGELKRSFNSVDKVGDYYVFDIGGNKYRLITAIHFNRQMVFIRHVFTHREYDKWKP